MMNKTLETLKEHINNYVDAHKQINDCEKDLNSGLPTVKGFNDIVAGFGKASTALANIGKLLETAQKEKPNNQQLTDIQKAVSKALGDTNEKFKHFFGG